MVKNLDDLLPDHIGWRLWQAAQIWKDRFEAGMIAAGHDWYAGARSSILPYVALTGTRQTEIVQKMGLSKQAVQQLIVDLEGAGVVERIPDPDDKRGKIVRLTAKGFAAQKDGVRIKQAVEAEFRKELGDDAFGVLYATLGEIGKSDK